MDPQWSVWEEEEAEIRRWGLQLRLLTFTLFISAGMLANNCTCYMSLSLTIIIPAFLSNP